MSTRVKKNYVNNKDLLEALSIHLKECADASEKNMQPPKVPTYIGECIYEISTRMSRRPNFAKYTFRDDMIMDGVENCLQYMHNFNPEKSQNPFAYFSQIIWNAFIRRIHKEKKQMYIRYKSSHSLLASGGTYEGDDIDLHITTGADYIDEFVRKYEESMNVKPTGTKRRIDMQTINDIIQNYWKRLSQQEQYSVIKRARYLIDRGYIQTYTAEEIAPIIAFNERSKK